MSKPIYKSFSGKRYSFSRTMVVKRLAEEYADNMRSRGVYARVVKSKGGHTIWLRKI